MAKKKAIIDFRKKDITFTLERVFYKVQSFNPNTMAFDVILLEDGEKREIKGFPFAHAPKEIKKLIKPN